MNSSSSVSSFRAPFTPSQWQELEHQALIFKYFMAGLPIPPVLLIPINTPTFFHHPFPTMGGYCSFYGKKLDPEPGRCRRTDGKKWRCAKDAHPDSKYCHRHMHRGRSNRSRKPVEPSSSSSAPTPRYYQEMKQQGEDHGLLADDCMNARGVVVGMGMESNWFSQSKAPQMQAGMVSKQHCFFGDEYGLAEPVKQEGQPLRPFFDEWPKMNRDSWCDLDEERSNQTQLSISIPMASSDFSATSSQSANGERR